MILTTPYYSMTVSQPPGNAFKPPLCCFTLQLPLQVPAKCYLGHSLALMAHGLGKPCHACTYFSALQFSGSILSET